MTITVIEHNGMKLLELVAGHGVIHREQDSLDVVAACMEHGVSRMLIDAACLSEEFFRLRTGLAGAVMQKFVNYGIRAAIVAPPGAAQKGKFKDFMIETNRGTQFRMLENRDEALQWLTQA